MALKGKALYSKNLHIMMSRSRHLKYRLVSDEAGKTPSNTESGVKALDNTASLRECELL